MRTLLKVQKIGLLLICLCLLLIVIVECARGELATAKVVIVDDEQMEQMSQLAKLPEEFASFSEGAAPCFMNLMRFTGELHNIDFDLLRVGSGYRNFQDMFRSAALINPILYKDGNGFSLNFKVTEIETGEELMTISCPAPLYRFTNSEKHNEEFPYLSVLLFRYAKTFGIERNDPYCWGIFASKIWCGTVPNNFKLDGNDTISFDGYTRPITISGKLKPEAPSSLRGKQKAEAEAWNKTAEDYFKQCAEYVQYKPLLISVETEAGKLRFLYDVNGSLFQYRLVYCMLDFSKILRIPLFTFSPEQLAELLLSRYAEDGVEDMYFDGSSYYWKDLKKKYVLRLIKLQEIEVFPIVDEETLYPLHTGKMVTQEMLKAQFDKEKPTTTDSRLVEHLGYVTQEFFQRPLTFEEFLRGKIGSFEWAMGFRKFGNSIQWQTSE